MKLPALISICFVLQWFAVAGQSIDTLWWVSFQPKAANWPAGKYSDVFSVRNYARHVRLGIPYDQYDAPVDSVNLRLLQANVAEVLFVSRWLNGAMVRATASQRQNLSGIGIMANAPRYTGVLASSTSLTSTTMAADESDSLGKSAWVFNLHNGQPLHQQGYTGNGVLVGVLDAGFRDVNTIGAFSHLWRNNRIAGQADIYDPHGTVFDDHTHGTRVLSVMAADSAGFYRGNAPDGSYFLVRTETVDAEGLFEEYAWVAGAEMADSAGCDLINTSLGYTVFDDSLLNHTHSQLDGQSTIIAKGVNIATSRGILVVVSAGNEGNKAWRYIGTPADAATALTVGAIDTNRLITTFSSRGPNAAGQIKPDVTAYGSAVPTITQGGLISNASGTSISSPVVCGFAACLLQANMAIPPGMLRQIIHQASDRYSVPDYDYGYGIPDFGKALEMARAYRSSVRGPLPIGFPNPFRDSVSLLLPPGVPSFITKVEITGMSGVVRQIQYSPLFGSDEVIILENMSGLASGCYILGIYTQAGYYSLKLVKQ